MNDRNIQLLHVLPETHPSLLNVHVFPVLVLSLLGIESTEGGIFSRITMTSMTSSWYLRLSHFEAILIGLIVLQIFVMRYFLILPLDVTKLIEDGTLLATSVSRKKRGAFPRVDTENVVQQQRLAEAMFSVLRRLDENDCFLRTLCEMENDWNNPTVKSGKISNLLNGLKRLGLRRIKSEREFPANNVTILERKVLAEFEDAVLLGAGYGTQMDSCEQATENLCGSHYSLCQADTNELLGYANKIVPFLP